MYKDQELDARKSLCEYYHLYRYTMPPKKVQIQRTGILSFFKKSSVKSTSCENTWDSSSGVEDEDLYPQDTNLCQYPDSATEIM